MKPKPEPEEEGRGNVVDLMAALRQSLGESSARTMGKATTDGVTARGKGKPPASGGTQALTGKATPKAKKAKPDKAGSKPAPAGGPSTRRRA